MSYWITSVVDEAEKDRKMILEGPRWMNIVNRIDPTPPRTDMCVQTY